MQKEIAEHMGIEEPTLVGLLNRLEADGWIKREESPNDRRCKIVHLQRRSKSVLDEIFSAAHELRDEVLEEVSSADLATCMRVLKQVRAKAEAAESTSKTTRNVTKMKRAA